MLTFIKVWVDLHSEQCSDFLLDILSGEIDKDLETLMSLRDSEEDTPNPWDLIQVTFGNLKVLPLANHTIYGDDHEN